MTDEPKARKDFYGDYDVVRREYTYTHLWTIDVAEALRAPQPGKRRTDGQGLHGRRLRLVARRDKDRLQRDRQPRPHQRRDVGHLRPRPGRRRASGRSSTSPGRTPRRCWSPDGTVDRSSRRAMGRPDYYAREQPSWPSSRRRAAPSAADRRPSTRIPALVAWNDGRHLLRGHRRRPPRTSSALDPGDAGDRARDRGPDEAMVSGFSFSARRPSAWRSVAPRPTALAEVCVSDLPLRRRAR
ncbi:MAG: hypothetical protein M0C28_46260 [Candidatus Moduliflexus flocculans]|nr:hypothetical protein [Candidatus Moduliflexus flocculans]